MNETINNMPDKIRSVAENIQNVYESGKMEGIRIANSSLLTTEIIDGVLYIK